jgi:hypothetical protein
MGELASDIRKLEEQLDAAEREARELVTGLSEQQGCWRANSDSWSVAQCLDHLATTNRVYLRAMEGAAIRAREQGRLRRRAATPGLVGRWFVKTLEPPVKRLFRFKAQRIIEPGATPPLAPAFADFTASQDEMRTFLRSYAKLDLATVRFPNPLLPGVRFSLATGLHIIAAHEKRHLWQAWLIRRAAERRAL